MCGLVGVAGNLLKKDTDFFKQALICDQLRGAHSTGIIAVDNKNECFTLKTADQGAVFVQDKEFLSLNNVSQKILAGHNRYATQGEVNDTNAHPFHHGEVVLMHNGTLYTRSGLSTDKKFEVDSEHIAYTIGKASTDAEIIDVLEELDGAFALVWYNLRTNKLYMARNDERPIALAAVGGCVYWASEEKMLDWLLDRNNIRKYEIKDLPEGELWCIDLSSTTVMSSKLLTKTKFTPAETYSYSVWNLPKKTTINSYPPHEDKWYECRFTHFTGYSCGERGAVYGYDITSGQSVAIYNVLMSAIGWDPSDATKVDENWVYCMKSYSSSSSAYTVSLEVAGSTRYYAEKNSTVIDTINVAGKLVSIKELQEIRDRGCGMCGNPFTDDELKSVKRDNDDFLYHSDSCYETAMKLFGEYDEA